MNRNKEFKVWCKEMKKRLDKGTRKYGDLMSNCDKKRALQEVKEELQDVCNHAYLLYERQLKMFERKELK